MGKALYTFVSFLVILFASVASSKAQCTVGIEPLLYPRYNGYKAVIGCDSTDQTLLEVIYTGTFLSFQWQYKSTATGTYSNVAGGTQGYYYPRLSGYYRLVVVRSATCTAYSDSIQATIFPKPPLQVSPTSVSVCAGTGINICLSINSGNAASEQYYKLWYRNGTLISGAYDTSSCRFTTQYGTYVCMVTDKSSSVCTDTISMVINGSSASPAPTVTSPIGYCQGATASGLTASGSNLKWYANATTASYSTTATIPATGSIGSTTYWVSQTVSGCESPRSSITVNVSAQPAAPLVTTPLSYCQNSVAGALSATGTGLKWYLVAAGGTPSAIAPIPVTTTAHADSFWVSQTTNGCEGPRARIIVNINPLPTRPTVSANSPVCAGDTVFLTALSALPAPIYHWSNNGAFSSTQQNPFIAHIAAADSGIYRATVTANGCTSLADSVNVKVICLDSVWAGDANADKFVDNLDALEIALALGSTGPARTAASIAWNAAAARDWATNLPVNSAFNRKHADCNGDGTVANSDTLAVVANYGFVHAKGIRSTHAKTAGLPDLRLDLSGITAIAGKPITVPIYFGNSSSSVPATAGIAAQIIVEGLMPADTPAVSYGVSWLGNAGNTLRFRKNISKTRVDWTYARNDHTSITGGGILGYLTFTIPSDAAGKMLKLYFDDVTIVNAAGTRQSGYNVVDDSVVVQGAAGVPAGAKQEWPQLLVSPNPSTGLCAVQVTLPYASGYLIEIRDLTGRVVMRKTNMGTKGRQTVLMPATELSAGTYLIRLECGSAPPVSCRWTKM